VDQVEENDVKVPSGFQTEIICLGVV